MAEVPNLSGGLVFWLYIVGALTATGLVIDAILRLPKPTTPTQSRDVKIFSILALFSFTALSFNMLSVLIQSFQLWLRHIPTSTITGANELRRAIWQWSMTSTLFQDFGEAIVEDRFRFVWTLSALFATFSICLYMGSEGPRRNIPRLWAFFALSQILPISFAQNLFYVAILRSSGQKERQSVAASQWVVWMAVSTYAGVLRAAFDYRAPNVWNAMSLMAMILLARLLLVVPFVLARKLYTESARHSDHATLDKAQVVVFSFAVGLIGEQFWRLRGVPGCTGQLLDALVSHPAVASLGFDFLVSASSFAIWTLVSRRANYD